MKKILAGILTMVMIGSLIGCSSDKKDGTSTNSETKAIQETQVSQVTETVQGTDDAAKDTAEGKKLLGVFLPSADHGFTAESIEQAVGALDEVKESDADFDYVVYNAAEASEQSNQVATAMDMYQFDAIMLWPIDGSPLRNTAETIMDAGIKLIVYDRLVPDFEPTAEMCGDNKAIGESTAKYFNEFFKDDLGDKVYIMEFVGDTSEASAERTNSFMENKDANIEVVQSFVTMWSRETAYNDMTNWLSNSAPEDIEKIQGIYIHDDEPLLGILDAIAQYNGSAKLNFKILTGVGAQKDVLDIIQSTYDIYGITILTNTFAPGMIRQCVDYSVGIMNGSGETGLKYIPVEQIIAENMDEYRKSDEYIYRYGQ